MTMNRLILGSLGVLALSALTLGAQAQTPDPGVEFGFLPNTMSVTLLNEGGKYVAIDLKHIAQGEKCRMDKDATIARVGPGAPGMVRVRYAAAQISSLGVLALSALTLGAQAQPPDPGVEGLPRDGRDQLFLPVSSSHLSPRSF